jgi:predicted nuclease of predicted toxin-antitoxin system
VRLVADENCDFSLVTDLRAAGYDVVAISEQMAGADDQRVIDFARSERRLLLTCGSTTTMTSATGCRRRARLLVELRICCSKRRTE